MMNNEMKLSGREKALLSRGYSLNDILEVSRISEDETREYASRIFRMITKDVLPEENPVVIFVGSQPGGGKSSMIRAKLRESREHPTEEPPKNWTEESNENRLRVSGDIRTKVLPEEPPRNRLPEGKANAAETHSGSRKIPDKKSPTGKGHFVVLAMDNYRTFHPNYKKLESIILEHWKGRKETYLDSPGSDIADFTQLFAGDVVDLLEEMVSGHGEGKKYNVLYEWAMRMPEEPLNAMRCLKERGYRVVVSFIAVNRKISLAACRQRSEKMNSKGRVLRTIPDNFHELSIERLPGAIDEIYRTGFQTERIIDRFLIVERSGRSLWDEEKPGKPVTVSPGEVFKDVLWNGPLDVENSDAYSEDAYWQEIQGFRE